MSEHTDQVEPAQIPDDLKRLYESCAEDGAEDESGVGAWKVRELIERIARLEAENAPSLSKGNECK